MEEMIFFDHGLPDTLCHVRLGELSSQLEQQVRKRAIDIATGPCLLAPPWREIYVTEVERKTRLRGGGEDVRSNGLHYLDCGYQVIPLPLMSVEERADFILKEIAKA